MRRYFKVVCTLATLSLAAGGCGDDGSSLPILFVQSAGGNGAGTVTSSPAGVNCTIEGAAIGGTCSSNFDAATDVTLSALPAAGSGFSAWAGGCTGATSTCTVTLNESADVTARFDLLLPRTLTITSGNGGAGGAVTSTPAGISCTIAGANATGTCSADFADGATVTLVAAGIGASAFTAWGGACAASGSAASCDLPMTADRSVSATFAPSVSFTSFVAVANSANPATGLLVVSIPSAVFSRAAVRQVSAPGLFTASAAAVLPADGTIEIFGPLAQTVDVTGTYDDVSKSLSLDGGGWSLGATISDPETGELDGSFSGPLGGGIIAGVTGGTSEARTILCGTYDGTDAGSWNLVRQDSLFSGITLSTATTEIFSLTGVLRNDDIVLASTSQTLSASGILAADGLSASGTWSVPSSGGSGSWTVASTDCQ